MVYWVPPMQGGIPYGQCPVHRPTGPPHGVPGYDQSHARRVSAPGLALRDRFPSAYGGVAARWETPDRASVYRVPALSTPDTGRSALVYSSLYKNLLTLSGPGTSVQHEAEQSQPMDSCPPPCPAGRAGRCWGEGINSGTM